MSTDELFSILRAIVVVILIGWAVIWRMGEVIMRLLAPFLHRPDAQNRQRAQQKSQKTGNVERMPPDVTDRLE